jgi:hypothetical protein
VTIPADEADRILAPREWGAEEVKSEKTEAGDEIDARKRR